MTRGTYKRRSTCCVRFPTSLVCKRSPEAIVRMRRHKAIGLVVDGLEIARSQGALAAFRPTSCQLICPSGCFATPLSSPISKNILFFRIPKSAL